MKKLLFVLLSLGTVADCQTSTRPAPDCLLNFSFVATGNSLDLNNIPQIASGNSVGGCVVWTVEASAFNSGAGTLTFQSASTSDALGSGPGTYATFGGTVISGATSSSSFPWTFLGGPNFYPWVRVNASALSAGTLRGTIMGWRNPGAVSSGGGGGGSTSVSNLLACEDSTKTFLRAAIQFTTATTTQIIAASGSTAIKICSLYYGTSGATNVSLLYGTGSSCGTGTTQITGTQGFQVNAGLAIERQLALPASQAFCMTSSAAVNIGGFVTYVQD